MKRRQENRLQASPLAFAPPEFVLQSEPIRRLSSWQIFSLHSRGSVGSSSWDVVYTAENKPVAHRFLHNKEEFSWDNF